MKSGKALCIGLVGHIRGGSTKEVPLGAVLKKKGVPEETNKQTNKHTLGRRRDPGEEWAGKYRDSEAA